MDRRAAQTDALLARASAACRQAAALLRQGAWGDTVADWSPEKADAAEKKKAPPRPVRRDDIRLFQPEESGLKYPVIAQYNEEHGSWDVLKQLDPPKKPKR